MSQLRNTTEVYGKFPIVIDGDFFAYRASSSVQKDIDWGDGLYTCHAFLDDAIDQYLIMLDEVKELLNPTNITIALSSNKNFRKLIYSEYKANRKNIRKPTCYSGLIEYIKNSEYTILEEEWFEADDLMGLQAYKDYSILVSADKDMKTIPGYFYNYLTGDLVMNTPEEAFKNTIIQALSGDRADNYPGIAGYGPIKATKYVDALKEDTENNILKITTDKFGEEFMTMYRLAKIVDNQLYKDDVLKTIIKE